MPVPLFACMSLIACPIKMLFSISDLSVEFTICHSKGSSAERLERALVPRRARRTSPLSKELGGASLGMMRNVKSEMENLSLPFSPSPFPSVFPSRIMHP